MRILQMFNKKLNVGTDIVESDRALWEAKGYVFTKVVREVVAPSAAPQESAPSVEGPKVNVDTLQPETTDLVALLGEELAATMAEVGITTAAEVRELSDEDLLAVSGIGKATLRRIRNTIR